MKQAVFLAFLFVLALPLAASPKPGDFLTHGPTDKKVIALTFDDGPGAQTPLFLDLLDKYHVKATFFMLGEQVQYRPAIAKDVLKRGHEIGSHTYNHTNYNHRFKELHSSTPTVKTELLADMKKTQALLEKTTGLPVKICRMPHGIDRPWIKEVAQEAGVVLVNWTYGADWTGAPEEQLKKEYVDAIKPGAIILLHDGNPHREKSLALTEAVLSAAQEKGYKIVPVGELIGVH